MGLLKGTSIINLKKMLRHSFNSDSKLYDHLTDDEKVLYDTCLEVTWVPIEFASKLFALTASLYYPDSSQTEALRFIGYNIAKNDLNKVYRFLFKFINLPSIIKKASTLWGAYHNQGSAAISNETNQSLDLIVTGYPDLPVEFCETTSGFIIGTGELTKKKDITVQVAFDEDRIIWHTTWKNAD